MTETRIEIANESIKSPNVFSLASMQLSCEVLKQLSIYGLQYWNGFKYPIPETVLVACVEGFKVLAVITIMKFHIPDLSLSSLKSSLPFLVPGVLYTLNNNIYLLGLTLVPPTIWLILCSARTVITAIIYRFFLFRPVSLIQFLGVAFIVLSLIIVKLPDFLSGVNNLPIQAIYLAATASAISVGAAVYSEVLFKRNSNSKSDLTFLEQQFFLYVYSFLIAILVHSVRNGNYRLQTFAQDVTTLPNHLAVLLISSIMFDGLGGLVVASILKHLDNIVKEYSGAVANILTAIFCAWLFPDKFQITVFVIFSLAFLLIGIFLYEKHRKKF